MMISGYVYPFISQPVKYSMKTEKKVSYPLLATLGVGY